MFILYFVLYSFYKLFSLSDLIQTLRVWLGDPCMTYVMCGPPVSYASDTLPPPFLYVCDGCFVQTGSQHLTPKKWHKALPFHVRTVWHYRERANLPASRRLASNTGHALTASGGKSQLGSVQTSWMRQSMFRIVLQRSWQIDLVHFDRAKIAHFPGCISCACQHLLVPIFPSKQAQSDTFPSMSDSLFGMCHIEPQNQRPALTFLSVLWWYCPKHCHLREIYQPFLSILPKNLLPRTEKNIYFCKYKLLINKEV